MKSLQSLDSTRLLLGLWISVTVAGALGVLSTPSVALSQGFWSWKPEQCEGMQNRGYGQVCGGSYSYDNDAGTIIGVFDAGVCCEGICGSSTDWCQPAYGGGGDLPNVPNMLWYRR